MRVLITGANRGIGAALFEVYRAAGAEVIGTTRASDDPDLMTLDVADPASIDAFSRALDGRPLDLLICNAGIYPDKGDNLADGFAPSAWAEGFAVNVTGVFLCIQELLPNLQCNDSAKIAIIGSQMGSSTLAPGGSYIYRATKAAVLNLGRNLASDLHGLGIAVGVYHPGWVRTEMGGNQADIDVRTAARGLKDRFDALDLSRTGCFESYDGRELPL